jgi:hypothetical protein
VILIVQCYVEDFKYFSLSDATKLLFKQQLGSKRLVDFMGEVYWFLGNGKTYLMGMSYSEHHPSLQIPQHGRL